MQFCIFFFVKELLRKGISEVLKISHRSACCENTCFHISSTPIEHLLNVIVNQYTETTAFHTYRLCMVAFLTFLTVFTLLCSLLIEAEFMTRIQFIQNKWSRDYGETRTSLISAKNKFAWLQS